MRLFAAVGVSAPPSLCWPYPGLARTEDTDDERAFADSVRRLEVRKSRDAYDYLTPIMLGKVFIQRAKTHGDISLYRKAEEAFKSSLMIKPDGGEALAALAEAVAAQHRFKESLELANHALELDPLNPELLGIRGDAQLNMGDAAGAEKSYSALRLQHQGYFYLTRESNLKLARGDTKGCD